MQPVLRIKGLHKFFGDNHVLKGIDFDVLGGERIAVIGGSGSGKSTLLRCLNFMEIPDAGEIIVDGELVGEYKEKKRTDLVQMSYSEKELCALRRRIGMVFQQFNLFPHMTVQENVMEGLIQVKKLKKIQAEEIANKQLDKVGLLQKINSYPSQLSGGQQQRVAIARALAMEPEVLLFDEPTSSLDPELVGEVLNTINELADEGRTMLLVTHELGFAYHFATKVIFFADGEFYEAGSPEQILKNPSKPKTQDFIHRFTSFNF